MLMQVTAYVFQKNSAMDTSASDEMTRSHASRQAFGSGGGSYFKTFQTMILLLSMQTCHSRYRLLILFSTGLRSCRNTQFLFFSLTSRLNSNFSLEPSKHFHTYLRILRSRSRIIILKSCYTHFLFSNYQTVTLFILFITYIFQ